MAEPMTFIDLTLELSDSSLSYPGTAAGLVLERIDSGIPDTVLSQFSRMDVHCGTHLDAPLHFVPGGADVTALPLVLPEIVVIRTLEQQIPLSALHGAPELRDKAVLFATGWERYAGTPTYFSGFPSLSPDLATALAEHGVSVVGIDSPSVDPPQGSYSAHRSLLGKGIPILEGLVQLRALSDALAGEWIARLIAFPLRVRSLEGSPVRAVAWIQATATGGCT